MLSSLQQLYSILIPEADYVCDRVVQNLSTVLRKFVAFLMQGNALTMQADALTMQADALTIQADALTMQADALALQGIAKFNSLQINEML